MHGVLCLQDEVSEEGKLKRYRTNVDRVRYVKLDKSFVGWSTQDIMSWGEWRRRILQAHDWPSWGASDLNTGQWSPPSLATSRPCQLMKERATQLCGSWPCRGSLQNSNLLAIVVKRGGACTLSSTTCPPYAPALGAGYMLVTELADIISSTMAQFSSH